MVTLVVSTHLCTPLPRIPPLYKAGLLWCCVVRTRKTTYDSSRSHSDHLEPRHLRTLDPRILITLGIPTLGARHYSPLLTTPLSIPPLYKEGIHVLCCGGT